MDLIGNDQFYITLDTASGIPAAGRKFVDNFDSDHVVCETVAYPDIC